MVLAQAEGPKDLATEEKAALFGIILEALDEALEALAEDEDEFVAGPRPGSAP
jgi:hypothetical protein